MKAWKIAYWIVTVLLSLFVLFASVPDILQVEGALLLFQQLQYPAYLLLIALALILASYALLRKAYGSSARLAALIASAVPRGSRCRGA